MRHPQDIAGVAGLHQMGITGKKVKVGILDYAVNFRNSGLAHQEPLSIVASNMANMPRLVSAATPNHHGTAMAGIVAARHREVIGIAPDSVLISVPILETYNALTVDDQLFAIFVDEAVASGIKVLNLSVNFAQDRFGVKERALRHAISRGCVVCCSAGNDRLRDMEGLDFPANLKIPGLIVVGAATLDRRLFLNAPFHENISLFAPGHHVLTLTNEHSEVWYMGPNDSSSAATAFVTGAVALLLQIAPNLTPSAISALLTDTGTALHSTAMIPNAVEGKRFLDIPAAVGRVYLKQSREAQ